MLRSILYDILDQDEALFYHRFQIEYRGHRAALRERGYGDLIDRHYESLKRVLSSLRNHPRAKPLYLTSKYTPLPLYLIDVPCNNH